MNVSDRARGVVRAARTAVRLGPREAAAFASAARALLVWRLRLRFPRALGRVQRLAAALTAPLPTAPRAPEALLIEAYRRAVASRLIGGSCLPRALALQSLLRDRGAGAVLRTGMRRRDGRLEGHVWVECGGRIVGDEESLVSGYTRFRHAGASG
jgi:hypothetical protein